MITSTDVTAAAFTETRFRAGYDPDDVDTLLAKVRTTLEAYERRTVLPGALTADQVVRTRFQPTKFRTGYDQDQVDDLLDQVVQALRGYEGTHKPTIH